MSQNDHSSQPNSRALWVIVPLAVSLSLMFTNLKYQQPKPTLAGNLGEMKHAASKLEAANQSHIDSEQMHHIALSAEKTLNVKSGSLEHQLVDFVVDPAQVISKDKWFNFDHVTFASGSTQVDASSAEQLKNLHDILVTYPKLKLKIGGYTDNVGDEAKNQALSQKRAESVVAELIKMGIPTERLQAEGYGSQHPMASNDSEEGRAKNRRMALRVVEK